MLGKLGHGSVIQHLTMAAYALGNGRENGLSSKVDIMIPVPLHRKRLLDRGFNQSLELARPLARKLKVPLEPRALTRQRDTQPQMHLTEKERAANVQDAFQADEQLVKGKSVLLVDDILTTGSTLAESCHVLLGSGAAAVDVLVVARTRLE